MDVLAGWFDWLNKNSGAVNALATSVSVVVTGLAAWSAIVTVTRAQRRERVVMDVFANPGMVAGDMGGTVRGVDFVLHNLGPAMPLYITFDFDRRQGDSISLSKVADSTVFLSTPLDYVMKWSRIQVNWLEPNGHRRRIRFWFRLEGEWDSEENRRKYLRLDRDERASYVNRPRYFRRRLAPWAYVGWRFRIHQRRKAWQQAMKPRPDVTAA